MTAVTAGSLQLQLPEGFVVLDATDPATVDLDQVPASLTGWHDQVLSARSHADAALVALQVEPWPDGPDGVAAVSLTLHLLPLDPVPTKTLVRALQATAQQRTSTSGEVTVLDLPLGPAVACAAVVETAQGPAVLVIVQLPLPALGRLLTLALSTPVIDALPACAALAVAVAQRLRLDHLETAP